MIPFRFFFDDEDQPQKAQVRTTGKPRFFRGAAFFADDDPQPMEKHAPHRRRRLHRGTWWEAFQEWEKQQPKPAPKPVPVVPKEDSDLELIDSALLELEIW